VAQDFLVLRIDENDVVFYHVAYRKVYCSMGSLFPVFPYSDLVASVADEMNEDLYKSVQCSAACKHCACQTYLLSSDQLHKSTTMM
jgi:hypothetical protein